MLNQGSSRGLQDTNLSPTLESSPNPESAFGALELSEPEYFPWLCLFDLRIFSRIRFLVYGESGYSSCNTPCHRTKVIKHSTTKSSIQSPYHIMSEITNESKVKFDFTTETATMMSFV